MTIPKLEPKKVIAIIVGVIAVSVGVFFGFRAVAGRASGEEPQDVQITNINENSATVTWTTGIEKQCTLEYGTSQTELNFFAPEQAAGISHSVSLTLLSAGTTYYFQIDCGGEPHTNGGVPWSFATSTGGNTPGAPPPVATDSATLEPSPDEEVVSPTSAPVNKPQPTSSGARPSPIQTLQVPSNNSCPYTDCDEIKANLGDGCTTQDYFKCVNSQ